MASTNRRTGYTIGGLVAVALLFQFFFRYQYEHLAGGQVMRIDRVTGSSCYMPCIPPTPGPTPSPPNYLNSGADYKRESDNQDQEAISLAKETATADQVVEPGSKYSWSATTTDDDGKVALATIAKYGNAWATPDPSDTNGWDRAFMTTPPPVTSASFQTKLVCYCDSKGSGWRWEVHTDTRAVYYANDNADLAKKYDLKPDATP